MYYYVRYWLNVNITVMLIYEIFSVHPNPGFISIICSQKNQGPANQFLSPPPPTPGPCYFNPC